MPNYIICCKEFENGRCIIYCSSWMKRVINAKLCVTSWWIKTCYTLHVHDRSCIPLSTSGSKSTRIWSVVWTSHELVTMFKRKASCFNTAFWDKFEVSQSSVKTLQQVPVIATLEFNGLRYNGGYNCYKVVLIKHKHCTRSYDVTIWTKHSHDMYVV